MNHNDLPSDELLQFVFGELNAARQAAVGKAVADDAELAATVQGLASAVAALRAENVGHVSDDFNGRLRQRMPEVLESGAPRKGTIPFALTRKLGQSPRPTFLSRSLTTWRWIMRSPMSRVAAAVIFVVAITGVVWWFHAGGATPAYADFLKPILEAKTARYKMITEMTGTSAGTTTTVVMMLGPSRSRSEMEIEMPNLPKSKLSKSVQIWDGYKGKHLNLDPERKLATVFDYVDRPKDKTPKDADPLGGWRSFLLDARKAPDIKREPLGEKDIDGQHVIGFRITTPTVVMDVWGDPKTGTPVRMDMTTPLMPNAKMTMRDFELNVDLDESLFSIEPPASYTVTIVKSPKTDDSPAGEKDLLETFRYYGELSGGTFPDLLDRETLSEMVYGGLWLFYSLDQSPTSSEKHEKEHYAAERKFDRGLEFAVLLPKESDSHYAGKGISLGAPDTPVFWYRPKDAKKYRIIYANLSIRQSETPPSMPIAPPGQPEKNLIEMLRMYSEWSGGTLPDALDEPELDLVFVKKNILADVPEKQNKRTSEQWKKIAAARVRIQRGMKFLNLLPKAADWHYAGRRVSLGAADTPIFWYRPKDAKKYRVIYADLTVREAATPPSMPYVLPEQDLIDMFRECGKLAGGQLPDSLDLRKMMEAYSRKIVKELFLDICTPPNGKLDEKKRRKIEQVMQTLTVMQEYDPAEKKPNKEEKAKLEEQSHKIDEELDKLVDWDKVAPGKKNLSKKQKDHYKDAYTQKFMESQKAGIIEGTMWTQPGLTFVGGLPPEADAHYAGKGVSLGAADKPIFWYRPKDAKKYRVIYADLSVRDADAPPSVPNAQPVPGKPSLKK